MSDIEYTASQKAVINEREKNILVSAAAGSGKTAVLVERTGGVEEQVGIVNGIHTTVREDCGAFRKGRKKDHG